MDGLQDFSVSPRPLRTNWGFELGWTGLGMGLGGLWTKGLGPGLGNENKKRRERERDFLELQSELKIPFGLDNIVPWIDENSRHALHIFSQY